MSIQVREIQQVMFMGRRCREHIEMSFLQSQMFETKEGPKDRFP